MPSQEELFRFFQEISEELYSNGYPILDNIIHPFPGFKFEEEIYKEQLRESSDTEDSNSEDDITS